MSLETRAGLIALLVLAAVVAALAFLRGGLDFRDRGYELTVRVVNAGGMTVGAPVQMAGIDIGRVTRLGLTRFRQAEIVLRIREGVSIPTGSRFTIGTSGLLGDRFITISPGPPDAPPMAPGSVIAGEDPFTIEALTDRIISLARRAEETLVSLNRLVGDPELATALSETARHAREATGVLARAAENVERTTQTIERSTRALDRTLTAEVPAIAQQLRALATELAGAAGEVRGLVTDVAAEGQTARQLRSTVASIEGAARGIERMVGDLQGVVNEQEVRAVRTSLAEARAAITEARSALSEGRSAVTEGRALIGRANRVVERVEQLIPQRLDLPGLRPPARLEYGLWYDGQRFGHDVSLTLLPDAPRSYVLTLREVGGANRIGLQIASQLNDRLGLRYGLIDSHLGVGLDYRTGPAFSYALDVYNISQLTLNLYMRYAVTPEYGLTLRAQDLTRGPTFGVGVSRRF